METSWVLCNRAGFLFEQREEDDQNGCGWNNHGFAAVGQGWEDLKLRQFHVLRCNASQY